MNEKEVLVTIEQVSQRYRDNKKVFTAVENINLTISEGEFIALLGPSGCGKSTLLRIITGLQQPSEGRVLYRGVPLRGVNPAATIVFQTFALFPWLSVQENVEVALKAKGIPEKIRTTRAIDLLDRVGLDGFENAYPRELSGGMRQKVGFARAMAVEPELLCLDEPFSALDVLSAESLRKELMELWLGGSIPTRAILMVSHNIEEAVSMADRIVLMDKDPGRIIADLPITLPHPRGRKDEAFVQIVDQVYGLLAGKTESEVIELGTAPGEPGRTRSLPNVNANELAGLMEFLVERGEVTTDIYRLTEELKTDSDIILRLIEALEILGFATVEKGDITITPLGEAFEASIQARKEIFATRLRRLPFFKWMLSMLRASEKNQLRWNVFQTALELEFPPDEAETLLETAVDWGRYAELIAYDDSEETIYLETELSPVRERV